MKTIQERTLLVGAAVMVGPGPARWRKFYQVHDAQNNVNGMKADIAALNEQVPKYDLVVGGNNAHSAGVARRASVLSSAVDWPLALSELIKITPANAAVQSSTDRKCSDRGGSPSHSDRYHHGEHPGWCQLDHVSGHRNHPDPVCRGPGPSLSISEAWIDAVAGSSYSLTRSRGQEVEPDNTTRSLLHLDTPNASLDKNASLK